MTVHILRPLPPRPAGRALTVGLTGGVGAGKSALGGLLEERGAVVVSADELARDVVAPGTSGLEQLVAEFGAEILDAEGTLNRAELAKIVFADPTQRRRLEEITHPLIAEAKRRIFSELRPTQVGVYDVPLLTENQMEKDFDVVVVVEAPTDQRLERLAKRGWTAAESASRIAAQASDEERRRVAHAVIINDAGIFELGRAADALFAELGDFTDS